jgi:hypothetical protein
MMYPWADPNSVLDLPIDSVFMYWEYGVDFMVAQGKIHANSIGIMMFGEPEKIPDEPDLQKFNSLYGDRIKRPEENHV